METLKRYLIFLVGLFVNSLGVSLITKANLGTSPISSIPYVLSLNFPFTLGNFTIFFSIFLIVLQLIILRKNFKLEHILQIPVSIIFGYFIDLTMILFFYFLKSLLHKLLIFLSGFCHKNMKSTTVSIEHFSFDQTFFFHTVQNGETKTIFNISGGIICKLPGSQSDQSFRLHPTYGGCNNGSYLHGVFHFSEP